MASQLLTIKQAMEYLDISEKTIYKLVKVKEFPAVKIMGEWRIIVDKLDKYYEVLMKNKADNV